MTQTDETIRAAIRARMEDGESLSEIARAAGYDHSQLSRFIRGERGLATGEKFDGLLRVLGLSVAPIQRGRRRARAVRTANQP